ncbi:MAG: DNA polymerase III subunit alpha [Alphaproteobacteria bacterium]
MSHASFIHLRVHSAYSLSEGAITIPELVKLCRERSMPAVGICDTGNLFGALEFSLAAAEAGVQPILGCQLAVRRDDGGPGAVGTRTGLAYPPDELVVLAQNEIGYRNLLALVSKAYLESAAGEPAQLSLYELAGRSEGLIAMTAGPRGAVGRLLDGGQDAAAAAMLERLGGLFPGRLYVELQRHGLEVETRIEPGLVSLAYAKDLPLVATNEPFFATADMYEAHDALLCIAEGAYVSQKDRRRVTREHHFKSAADMRALFADLPEAVDNTLVVARRCAYMPSPRQPILPPFPTESGRGEAEELRAQAEAGLETRLERHVLGSGKDDPERATLAEPYRERLAYELDVIEKMGFAGYFLIVSDFIKWARSSGIPVGPGRGSGAGSVVAWSLTITDLDPLRWGLIFERFLNPERVSMPDFDIDFCQDRRDEVIDYVRRKYGQDRVAQIITFGKLQARAVLRDVGRVLEMPYSQVDRICKLVPNNPASPISLARAIETEPLLAQMRKDDETVAYLLDTALKLEGLYRNSSTHAAGVVIGDRPLQELVPLYRDPKADMLVTQFSMKYVEQAGLIKFDFLGLKTLTVLARAVELLRRRGIEVDLDALPLDDPKTFELMSRGDTLGVFQFEGPGMRNLLRDSGVGTFEDIIALVALYRPGPMENIPKYVACKHGREKPEFLHESIEPVVADTYGVIIYQEQVIQIAQVFAGFTPGQADLLRLAMGKKIKSEMQAQRDTFVEGALARNVSRERAEYVFDLVDKFAGYGFNKAHSAGYALVAYQTAYFKANYPVAFLAATMSYDMSNTDKLAVFRQELDRLGIPLLPPDVNRSESDFVVEQVDGSGGERTAKMGIRYALGAVKGVGRAAMNILVRERAANGPFRSLFDVAGRIDPQVLSKRQLEQLASAGAFDSLNPDRAQVRAATDMLLSYGQVAQQDRRTGQTNLFGDAIAAEMDEPRLPGVAEWSQAERLQHELETLGFYLSAHPLDEYESRLERLGVVQSSSLPATVASQGGAANVKLAGSLLSKRERTSQRGSRYAFVQLSDAAGAFEVTVFAETLAEARELLEGDRPVLVHAAARLDDDQIRLTAQRIEDLDAAAGAAPASLRIWLDDASPLQPLKNVVEAQAGGGTVRHANGRITLILTADDNEVEIALQGSFSCTPQLRAAVRAIPGVVEVREI